MALISIIENFKPLNDERLLRRAEKLRPVMSYKNIRPVSAFRLKDRYSSEITEIPGKDYTDVILGKGDNICLDFGDHQVGRLFLELAGKGSHPDAPAFIKLKFAETLAELSENSREYNGWVSSSWIQEEYIHADVLPAAISPQRRYAFRYLKITVIDTSPKYKLTISRVMVKTETSADDARVLPAYQGDPELNSIYRMCQRTIRNCMQDVFEDGPKRDRRLWTGDLRLQALANYATYGNNDLVKRCLYLFAGSRFPDGRVAACVFVDPEPEADDTCLYDYMLLYTAALWEYLEETGDQEALGDLYDIAQKQIDIALGTVDENGLVHGDELGTVFIDWADDLHKDAAAQGVLIYAMHYAVKLAEMRGDRKRAAKLTDRIGTLKQAAREHFWDPERACFVCDGQAALATQVWMVLAGCASEEEAAGIFERADDFSRECTMMTPYMHHYYIMALLSCGRKEQALGHIRWYWGSMVKYGFDTCPETWVPDDPSASPYGGTAVNSYCHAWSCTPVWILKKYFK